MRIKAENIQSDFSALHRDICDHLRVYLDPDNKSTEIINLDLPSAAKRPYFSESLRAWFEREPMDTTKETLHLHLPFFAYRLSHVDVPVQKDDLEWWYRARPEKAKIRDAYEKDKSLPVPEIPLIPDVDRSCPYVLNTSHEMSELMVTVRRQVKDYYTSILEWHVEFWRVFERIYRVVHPDLIPPVYSRDVINL